MLKVNFEQLVEASGIMISSLMMSKWSKNMDWNHCGSEILSPLQTRTILFGRIWRKNAISIGLVIHGGCMQAGHGPGVVTLLSSKTGKIETVKDRNANIGRYLNLGRYRKKK